MSRFHLTTTRMCRVLTPMGWLALLVTFSLVLVSIILFSHEFLAPTKSVKGEVLVVEGWLPDYALVEVKERFEKGKYRLLVTTGGRIGTGYHLSGYKTWASLTAARLNKLGIPPEKIMSTSQSVINKKDRTYHSILALNERFKKDNLLVKSMDVVSLGVHARRTWVLYKKVFASASVGIIAIQSKGYDPLKWWLYSAGVRGVISEMIAYLYVQLIFNPPS
jgi:hypothetical protein